MNTKPISEKVEENKNYTKNAYREKWKNTKPKSETELKKKGRNQLKLAPS